jgi:hypothetical protein
MSASRLDPGPRRAARARRLRRRRAAAGLGLVAVVVLAIALLAGGGGSGKRSPGKSIQEGSATRARTVAHVRVRATVARSGTLPAPVQDVAAAEIAQQSVLLMGGLDQAEGSVGDILSATPTTARRIGMLPTALHDASASVLGRSAYLFGGGVVASFPRIIGVDASGATHLAGQLPTPASDIATANVDGTVYVVGGYTGQTPLRTILAWRPGEAARVVGTLPKPLRYAAVASAGGQLVIAGGTSGEAASRDVYRFDPRTHALSKLGLLPSPLTHAAAASVGGTVLVLGGRDASPTSQTRRILAIGPDGSIHTAGLLPRPLSDLAAVALGSRVLLAGGRDNGGRVQDAILTVTVTPS